MRTERSRAQAKIDDLWSIAPFAALVYWVVEMLSSLFRLGQTHLRRHGLIEETKQKTRQLLLEFERAGPRRQQKKKWLSETEQAGARRCALENRESSLLNKKKTEQNNSPKIRRYFTIAVEC